jgi:hypothetical protein
MDNCLYTVFAVGLPAKTIRSTFTMHSSRFPGVGFQPAEDRNAGQAGSIPHGPRNILSDGQGGSSLWISWVNSFLRNDPCATNAASLFRENGKYDASTVNLT